MDKLKAILKIINYVLKLLIKEGTSFLGSFIITIIIVSIVYPKEDLKGDLVSSLLFISTIPIYLVIKEYTKDV